MKRVREGLRRKGLSLCGSCRRRLCSWASFCVGLWCVYQNAKWVRMRCTAWPLLGWLIALAVLCLLASKLALGGACNFLDYSQRMGHN
jgi:hypothetical protein